MGKVISEVDACTLYQFSGHLDNVGLYYIYLSVCSPGDIRVLKCHTFGSLLDEHRG